MSVPCFTEPQVREAVAASRSYAEVLRRIRLRPVGGNFKTIQRYVDEVWRIPTGHFDPYARLRGGGGRRDRIPLEAVLVAGSTYHRAALKRRLFEEGLKARVRELCGQGEIWHGRRMALILDHVNGDAVDNRLENLRIVCANCNATLETHCGRTKPCGRPARDCDQCGGSFRPTHADQRFCSRECGSRFNAPARRTVRRPTVGALLTAIDSGGYLEAGRRFGVSDNAIRKWLRWEGVDPPPGAAGVRHPPPVRRALTDEQAITALALIAGGASDRSVAEKLGTSRWCVRDLRRGRSYRHLPRPAPDATPAPSTMPP